MNYCKQSGSVFSVQTRGQTQWQAIPADRSVWFSLESTRPACAGVWTSLDRPGTAWSTCDERSHHTRPITAPPRRRGGSDLRGWRPLLIVFIVGLDGAVEAHLWLVGFCLWGLGWGHHPQRLAVLTGPVMWHAQRRLAVRGETTKTRKLLSGFTGYKRKPQTAQNLLVNLVQTSVLVEI